MKSIALLMLAALSTGSTSTAAPLPSREALELFDRARNRPVPIELQFPARRDACTPARPCPVALISPGYGLPPTAYSFIAEALAEHGTLAALIRHELPSDPALVTAGDPMTARMPMWRRGADNLRFAKAELARRYPGYDWARLQLIGHSNGGDISALALHESPDLAAGLITLDHRRYPLPRTAPVRTLSIRGSDFEADPGVLPSEQEQAASGACIVRIAGARHNDMHDGGPAWLRTRIVAVIGQFLRKHSCDA